MHGQLSLIAVQPNYPWRRWGICGMFLAHTGDVVLTPILALTACKGKNSK